MKKTKLSPETLEKLKRYASVALVSAGVVSFVAAMLFFSAYPDAPFPDYWKKLFTYVQYVLLSICTIPIGCVFVFFTMKAVESTTLRTAARRLGLTINQRMLLKNAAYINPNLLEFLYAVLRANNETLHLPLGQDASALIPNGYCPVARAGCVFYRYQLVLPEAPEIDMMTLRNILRQYLWAQARNYGVAGLAAGFKSRVYGWLTSVFLDRVWYNETNHLINMEVLYICSEDAAQYAVMACQRDKEQPRTEPEVYDDQI